MRHANTFAVFCSVGLLVILLSGCAGVKPALFADPDLADLKIDTVTLLPIVDRRVDKSKEIDYERYVGNRVRNELNSKGYTVIRAESFSEDADIPNDAVKEMTPVDLATLGSSSDQYLVIIYLDDASGSSGLGYSFKIELTSVLVDKGRGALLWKSKAIGNKGSGGLMGLAFSGDTQAMAIKQAINALYSSLPKAARKR